MIIKRIEDFGDDIKDTRYLLSNGFWGSKIYAREFNTKEDAEDFLDMERSDPKYDKPHRGICTFEIIEN